MLADEAAGRGTSPNGCRKEQATGVGQQMGARQLDSYYQARRPPAPGQWLIGSLRGFQVCFQSRRSGGRAVLEASLYITWRPGPESAAHHELRVVYTAPRGAERCLLYGAYSRQKCDTEFAQHRFSDRLSTHVRLARPPSPACNCVLLHGVRSSARALPRYTVHPGSNVVTHLTGQGRLSPPIRSTLDWAAPYTLR